MQWGLTPARHEDVLRVLLGSGGFVAPQALSLGAGRRCSNPTVCSCKALPQLLQGSVAGTAAELCSVSHLCFPNTSHSLLLLALPCKKKKKKREPLNICKTGRGEISSLDKSGIVEAPSHGLSASSTAARRHVHNTEEECFQLPGFPLRLLALIPKPP